jgi:cell shape-determining protein MreD
MFGLPILCDMVGFATLTLTVWWIRKFGAATAVGIIATVVNFIFNPYGVHFLGFMAASIAFDIAAKLIGYDRSFSDSLFTTTSMFLASVLSAAVAGLIIGTFFMEVPALARWGGILGWAGLHAVGGIIGGSIGIALVAALAARGVRRIYVKT